MRNKKQLQYYLFSFTIFIILAFLVFNLGGQKNIPVSGAELGHMPAKPEVSVFKHPLAIFILQIIIIITVSRVLAFLFRKINQPAVLGEIVAGILLGPSLLGWLMPDAFQFLFPTTSIPNIKMLSQIGLILFMFVIGMELDLKIIKKSAAVAVIISHSSILFPFLGGLILAYFLYDTYAINGFPFYSFALFMGIAMSITAFPVLARIIKERHLTTTRIGNISLTSAAIDDITAWCLLAAIIAISKAGSVVSSLMILLYTLLYVAIMFLAIKPFLNRLFKNTYQNDLIQQSKLAIVFIVLLSSAWICEIIGVHALFGAFVAGVIMPEPIRNALTQKIEDVALVLLLPLFFVVTGLQTHIGLLNSAGLWMLAIVIIAVAILGKLGGSAIAARISGETWSDSLSIGALMNTRGLIELVVLNIGLELGILSPEMFAMLVLMAIVTTFLTSPLLSLFARVKK